MNFWHFDRWHMYINLENPYFSIQYFASKKIYKGATAPQWRLQWQRWIYLKRRTKKSVVIQLNYHLMLVVLCWTFQSLFELSSRRVQAWIERSKGGVQSREMVVSLFSECGIEVWFIWKRGQEAVQMVELMTLLRSLRLSLKKTLIIQL